MVHYKKSPKWNRIHNMDTEIKNIEKGNEKFGEYMDKLKTVVTNAIDSDEDLKERPPSKIEILKQIKIKGRITARQQKATKNFIHALKHD